MQRRTPHRSEPPAGSPHRTPRTCESEQLRSGRRNAARGRLPQRRRDRSSAHHPPSGGPSRRSRASSGQSSVPSQGAPPGKRNAEALDEAGHARRDPSRAHSARRGRQASRIRLGDAAEIDSSEKNCSKPAGEMISRIRARLIAGIPERVPLAPGLEERDRPGRPRARPRRAALPSGLRPRSCTRPRACVCAAARPALWQTSGVRPARSRRRDGAVEHEAHADAAEEPGLAICGSKDPCSAAVCIASHFVNSDVVNHTLRTQAAIGHRIAFSTWKSLVREQGRGHAVCREHKHVQPAGRPCNPDLAGMFAFLFTPPPFG